MKNIPMFTGEYGVATLILAEIPIKGAAFVLVRSAQPGRMGELLQECRSFCRACGAEEVYASAQEEIFGLEKAYDVVEYCRPTENLPPVDDTIELVQVTRENMDVFLLLYNRMFQKILGSATCFPENATEIADKSCGYLGYVQGEPVAIGQVEGNVLAAIGVIRPGLGYPMATHLLPKAQGETVTLRVNSTNAPAIRLYEKLGFAPGKITSSWYKIEKTP